MGKKIAESMFHLAQINIYDIETGKMVSSRLKDTPDESIFETDMSGGLNCYNWAACDDKYIYALWSGTQVGTSGFADGCKWLHQFDWDGNFIRRIELSVPVFSIWLDDENGLLYGYNLSEDKIYRYDLNV